ncbi:MAG: nucleotidyltransferase family protein [Syntrophomonadaceae bacterium]|nr:nucleotidyltransferase family protein [Syntrophomonadaceae bacterium]MDD3889899.1 nucleotidyltransferase family protein [Syntrophomonadaceae bacterium]MDD4548967.1 nucleotidyltransferase family protein [Syntrophomonadaceae bacterium]
MTNSVFIQLQKDREKIKKIALKNKAKTISVFGSVARREEQQNSDIDLLVEFNENASLFDLINLKLELEEIYHRKVDIVTPNSLHQAIASQVMNEAVPL